MPLLLVALCAFGPKVTIHARAQPLSLLLPTLSTQIGRALEVQPSLAREQLVIEAKETDPEALLARIAEVTHAEWVQEKDAYRLRRTPEREKALAVEELAFHAENLRAHWSGALKAPYDVTQAVKQRREAILHSELDRAEYRQGEPIDRYLFEILKSLPPGLVPSLLDGRGFVMSNRPTGSQRPFPAATGPVLARLFQDQARFSAAMFALDPEEYGGSPATVAHLSITVTPITPGVIVVSAHLTLRDDHGENLASSSPDFVSPVPDNSLRQTHDPTPFQIGAVAKDYETIIKGGRSFVTANSMIGNAPLAVQGALLNPERDGRLTQAWSDILFGLAAKEASLLVANLPDTLEARHLPVPPEGLPMNRYLLLLSGMEVRREKGWITLRPRFPSTALGFRADRAAAGGCVRAIAQGRAVSLEEAGSVLHRTGRGVQVLLNRVRALDMTFGVASGSLYSDRLGLEILRNLSPKALRTLYSGRPLAFGHLSPPLQAALRKFYLECGAEKFAVTPEDGAGKIVYDATALVGVPQVAGLAIDAEVNEELAFLCRSSTSPLYSGLLTAERLAKSLDINLRPLPPTGGGESAAPLDRFRVVTSRRVALRIHFPNGYYHEIFLYDHLFDSRSALVPLTNLPAPVLEHLRKLIGARPSLGCAGISHRRPN
jgi:hypothetical protein